MRVKLRKGKQKELIISTKNNNNFTLRGLAEYCGVARTTMGDWIIEKNLLPLKVFNKLDTKDEYKEFIVEYKRENWGKSKGGINSQWSTKKIRIPNQNEKLAEFIGILLGDGNITYYKKGKKIGTYMIRIAGDSRHDYEYLTNYVAKLSKDLFSLQPRFHKGKNSNVIYLSLYGINLVQYFSKMGLKSGNKIKNQLTMPKWIWKKNSYLKACIRGLIDTDGSVYELLPHWPGLYQINFSNSNLTLIKDVRDALIKLDYKVSKISNLNKKNTSPRIYITRKDQIKKFYNNIGFKNPRHLKKFINSPVV